VNERTQKETKTNITLLQKGVRLNTKGEIPSQEEAEASRQSRMKTSAIMIFQLIEEASSGRTKQANLAKRSKLCSRTIFQFLLIERLI
jgi:hypothetical protein